MQRYRFACLGVLASVSFSLVGCGGASSGPTSPGTVTTATPTPRPSVSATPAHVQGGYAILTGFGGPNQYAIKLVDAHGATVATATASPRSRLQVAGPAIVMPEATASASRAYFLDGDSTVRSLTPAGVTSMVTRIPGSSTAEAGFAVSPDESRIAVSVIDYNRNPPSVRLYTEDLVGGGNHTEVFTSSSLYVWPVAWRAQGLVLAVGPAVAQYAANNPYDAIGGYHVVDAQSANRLASICSSPSVPVGAIAAIGTLCAGPSQEISLVRWDGSSQSLPNDCSALSPGGQLVACGGGHSNSAPTGPIALVRLDGTRTPTPAQGFGPLGFVDDDHLIFAAGPSQTGDVRLIDLKSGAVTPIGADVSVVGRVG